MFIEGGVVPCHPYSQTGAINEKNYTQTTTLKWIFI